MSRTKSFLLSAFSSALMQLSTLAAGLVTPRIVLSAYGSEINGLIASVSQFLAYFSLVEAGLSGAAAQALYGPLATSDSGRVCSILSAAKKMYARSGWVFAALTACLAAAYPAHVGARSLGYAETSALILVLGASSALDFFALSRYRVLLAADQRAYVVSLAVTCEVLVNVLIISTAASARVHIVALRLMALCAVAAKFTVLRLYCRKKYPYLDFGAPADTSALKKRWDALYLQVLGIIHSGAPVVLITLILKDLRLVSVYAVYNMVVSGVGGLVGVAVSGLSASFGNILAKKETETLKKAYGEFEFLFYCLIALAYSVTLATAMPFVRIYTAGITDFDYDMPAVCALMAVNGLVYNFKTPQGLMVISAGLYRETRRQTTIQGLIAVAAGAAGAPLLGMAGVVLGSIASNVYRDIDLLLYVPRTITGLPARRSFLRVIRTSLCVLVASLPFVLLDLRPSGYGGWLLLAACAFVASIFAIAACALVFERGELKNVASRLKSILGRKR